MSWLITDQGKALVDAVNQTINFIEFTSVIFDYSKEPYDPVSYEAIDPAWSCDISKGTEKTAVSELLRLSNEEHRIEYNLYINDQPEFYYHKAVIYAIDIDDIVTPFAYYQSDSPITKIGGIPLTIQANLEYPGISTAISQTPLRIRKFPYQFRKSELWNVFSEAFSRTLKYEVDEAVNDLIRIRDTDQLPADLAKLALFDKGLDPVYLELSNDMIRQLNQFLPLHFSEQQTRKFIKFISYVLRRKLTISQLWSLAGKDALAYGRMREANFNAAVWKGGSAWPTSHFDLFYDAEKGGMSTDHIRKIFYALAPIEIVLRYVTAAYYGYTLNEEYMPGKLPSHAPEGSVASTTTKTVYYVVAAHGTTHIGNAVGDPLLVNPNLNNPCVECC